jgi:hypothetical protein
VNVTQQQPTQGASVVSSGTPKAAPPTKDTATSPSLKLLNELNIDPNLKQAIVQVVKEEIRIALQHERENLKRELLDILRSDIARQHLAK